MPRECAILVGLGLKQPGAGRSLAWEGTDYSAEESLEELAILAASAGAEVTGRLLQTRPSPEAATLIGAGKVEELARLAEAEGADLVIFDQNLTPTQQRNLERLLARRVIDRTQLILDIFARRARSREGQLQVELAQLNYLLPRLAGRGVEMSRLGGGIGTRGPGETQLETDRRRIFRRIRKLEEHLEAVRAGRAVQRRQRQALPLATAAVVGYTNAGKSTLFNRLTGAAVAADARMFATLDPTVRAITLPSNRRILLGDTVGFIRNLPVTLVKAFRATLEEVTEATLILHVADASSPHAAQQVAHIHKVLAEIGAGQIPQVLALNKVDLLPEGDGDAAAWNSGVAASGNGAAQTRAVGISARTGAGVDRLLALIDEVLPFDPLTRATFRFALGDGARLHLVHQLGRVTARRYGEDYCEVEAEVSQSLKNRLAAYLAPAG
ncbi:MAG: GTPase HflX [Acidobacteriota bacterium]